MKKRAIAFLCAFVLLLGCGVPMLLTYGAVGIGSGEAELLQEGEFDLPTVESAQFGTMSLTAVEDAEEGAYQQLLNAPSQIDLTAYRIPVDDVETFYSKVINDHPDLFYVSSSYSYNYYPSTGCAALIFPQYAMDASEIAAAKEIFDAGVAEALAEVDDSMTDEQKVIVLHDYICSQALYPVLEYDNNGYLSNDQDIWHSAYGFFYNQTVVCAGFTLAYSYLMNALGIPCEYVSSDSMQHAWNRVKLNGSWYNVDLTYDNFDLSQGVNTFGAVKHRHMLKSDSYFASENGSFHYDGQTYDDTSGVSTAYDDAFFNDVTARIYVKDSSYYYLKPGTLKSLAYLKKRTQSGAESDLTGYFTSISLNWTSRVYDSDNVQHTITFSDTLARLAYLDNRFYVSAGNKLYSVLMDGTKQNITDVNNYCLGLDNDANGNLIYNLYPDNSFHQVDKLSYFNDYLTASKSANGAAVNYNNYPDINLDGVVNAKDYALILEQRGQRNNS